MDLPDLTPAQRAQGMAGANMVLFRYIIATMLEAGQMSPDGIEKMIEAVPDRPTQAILRLWIDPITKGRNILGKPN